MWRYIANTWYCRHTNLQTHQCAGDVRVWCSELLVRGNLSATCTLGRLQDGYKPFIKSVEEMNCPLFECIVDRQLPHSRKFSFIRALFGGKHPCRWNRARTDVQSYRKESATHSILHFGCGLQQLANLEALDSSTGPVWEEHITLWQVWCPFLRCR